MSATEELFQRLSEGDENAEQVSVSSDRESGTVSVELGDTVAELDSDEARTFAETLRADAKEEGWYRTGQTKTLVEEIQESADAVD